MDCLFQVFLENMYKWVPIHLYVSGSSFRTALMAYLSHLMNVMIYRELLTESIRSIEPWLVVAGEGNWMDNWYLAVGLEYRHTDPNDTEPSKQY